MTSELDCVLSASNDEQSRSSRTRWDKGPGVEFAPLRSKDDEPPPRYLQYVDIVMDLSSLRVKRGDRLIPLNPTEFRLLRLLLEQPERAFTRDELKDRVWGFGAKLDARSISVYLGRLRRALTACGEDDVIRTITGYGYSLDAFCGDNR